jgi:hypothetical protein
MSKSHSKNLSVSEHEMKKIVGLNGDGYYRFILRMMTEAETTGDPNNMDHRAPTMLFNLLDKHHLAAQCHHTNMSILSKTVHDIKSKREKPTHVWHKQTKRFTGVGYEIMAEQGWAWKSTKWHGIPEGWVTKYN